MGRKVKILQRNGGTDKAALESDGKLFEVQTGRNGGNCVTLND